MKDKGKVSGWSGSVVGRRSGERRNESGKEDGSDWVWWGVAVMGAVVRMFLSFWGGYEVICNSYEVETPATSFKRALEGVYLLKSGSSAYAGSGFHGPPLVLALFVALDGAVPWVYDLLFIGLDLLCYYLIYEISKVYAKTIVQEDVKKGTVLKPGENAEILRLPEVVSSFYFLFPFTIISCVGRSTVIFLNLCILITLYYSMKGKIGASMFFCALSTYLGVYPAVLLGVLPVIYARVTHKALNLKLYVLCVLVFLVVFGTLLGLSYVLVESWDFLRKSFGFILLVDNMQPNIGLFWYLLTEMFQSFRVFYVCLLQLHIFIYAIPIAIGFKDHPLFAAWVLLGIIATFKSYPMIGDLSLYISLVPLFYHKLYYFQYSIALGTTFLYLSLLYPLFWKEWIWYATGNPNFYYALNLVTSIANVLLVTDAMDAIKKRDFLISNYNKKIH